MIYQSKPVDNKKNGDAWCGSEKSIMTYDVVAARSTGNSKEAILLSVQLILEGRQRLPYL